MHFRSFAFASAIGVLLLVTSCKTDERDDVCAVVVPKACPEDAPTYADVAPIFDRSCNGCHTEADPDGPWPLDTYERILLWEHIVRDEIEKCSMPPVPSEVGFSVEDRKILLDWGVCEFPEK